MSRQGFEAEAVFSGAGFGSAAGFTADDQVRAAIREHFFSELRDAFRNEKGDRESPLSPGNCILFPFRAAGYMP